MKLRQCMYAMSLVLLSSQALIANENPSLQLQGYTYLGTGCSASENPVSAQIEDGKLRILFPQMIAEMGPNIPVKNARKNCILYLKLIAPEGYQYALSDYELRGFVGLGKGTKAELRLSNFFEGTGQTMNVPIIHQGPVERDFVYKDSISIAQQVWSSCGAQRSMALSMSLRVMASRSQEAQGILLTDATGLSSFAVQLRKCL